jgi:hypothetical protein
MILSYKIFIVILAVEFNNNITHNEYKGTPGVVTE